MIYKAVYQQQGPGQGAQQNSCTVCMDSFAWGK